MTVINEEQAAGHIHGICLKTGPPRLVGVELEWLVRDLRDPALPVSAERIAAAVGTFAAATGSHLPTSAFPGVLPSGALLTTEPGGQLELSSLPAASLADCVRDTAADLAALRTAAASVGLELAGIGLDPYRSPHRVLDLPRYAAMEAFFDADGPWGREMMCATASVQVCLDAGDDSDGFTGYRWRWRLLHAIGPVLVGAFANSPLRGGRPTGWRSSRQQVWAHMDPGRTRVPGGHSGRAVNGARRALGTRNRRALGTRNRRALGTRNLSIDNLGIGDPRAEWADYALDALVMLVRDGSSANWAAPPGLTFRDWVRGGRLRPPAALRPPTTDDLAYHLTTLFPPVRPRGHFELRMIDAQPGDGWVVPLAVVTALLCDESAADAALAATAPLWNGGGDPWLRAARLGPADPGLARASRGFFAAARSALDRMAVPAAITAAVDDFTGRYVMNDRCPADDLLDDLLEEAE